MTKRVVYTAIFNNYDTLFPINFKSKIKFVCFTDNINLKVKGWDVIYIKIKDSKYSEKNRNIKMFPNLYLKNFSESLYLDGNIRIKKDPEPLFDKYLKNNYIAIAKHPFCDCLYKELEFFKKLNRVNKEAIDVMDNRIIFYHERGMPKNYGLWENNIILRKNNHPQNIVLSQLWWEEYRNGVKRDQISFPYLIWLKNIKIGNFLETPRLNNKYFEYELHNNFKTKNLIILIKRISNIRKKQSFFYLICFYFFQSIEKFIELFLIFKDFFLKKYKN